MTGNDVKSQKLPRRTNLSVILYLEELTSRIVAKTGIPTDRHHLGKIILHSLQDAPDFILQVDGGLGRTETNKSVLERSVRCAIALRNLGLQRGDVIVFMGHNHLELAIAIYAALYLGIIVAGVDINLNVQELEATFDFHKPKLVLCQSDKATDIDTALKAQNLQTHIITFDKGNKHRCFEDFIQTEANGTRVEDFKPADFDPEETIAFLTATSGTTGLPKAAILTHKNLAVGGPFFHAKYYEFPTPTRMYLMVSPLQWLSAGLLIITSPIFRFTRLQSSSPATKEHIYELINKYKPTAIFCSPTLMTTLVATGNVDKCVFSSLEVIALGGSQLTSKLVDILKTVAPQADIDNMYGMSEATGLVFAWGDGAPGASIGKLSGHVKHRLVDPTTLENINEPNVPGELWISGPSIFKGYYNNPEASKEAFSDEWFKTGVLISRDNFYNYYFVDRYKSLLKYRNHQISPVEVEGVILWSTRHGRGGAARRGVRRLAYSVRGAAPGPHCHGAGGQGFGESLTYQRRNNLGSSFYVEDLAARVIAQTGIPTDRFHLGKLIFQSLKESPDFVLQIDGAVDKSETSGSALARSVRCATAMTNLGLKKGDVVVLLAPNHVDITIPVYASMFLGVCLAGTDMTLGVRELEGSFKVNKPNIVFCQSDKATDVDKALKGSDVNGHIVTFDEGSQYQTFSQFLNKYSDSKVTVDNFKPADFDPEETVINLCATSGTTGLPKSAILTHKNLTISLTQLMARYHKFPEPTRMYLLISPSQWLSATMLYITSAVFKFTRLQTSATPTRDHIYDLINKYKPTAFLSSPTLMMNLLEEGQRERCDFTCFETCIFGGSFVPQSIFDVLKDIAPNCDPDLGYGMSEVGGIGMAYETEFPKGCVGKPSPHLYYKLVNPETLEEITEPNVAGELWFKGPTVFKGYYNNPEATKEALVDGWLRSGDLLRRDESNHYFFVDRLKTLLKYRNHQISPIEIEGVILKHPGVHDAVVVGVLEKETGGDLPTAFVVPKSGHKITAQEIKDIVKENLADTKQLRGGVIFIKELPLTVTSKVDRPKLKKMAAEMERE